MTLARLSFHVPFPSCKVETLAVGSSALHFFWGPPEEFGCVWWHSPAGCGRVAWPSCRMRGWLWEGSQCSCWIITLHKVVVACPCSCSPTWMHQLPKDKGSGCTTSWQLLHSFSSIPLLWPWGQSGSWSPNHQLSYCYQIIYTVK